jgi:hypothetical protein
MQAPAGPLPSPVGRPGQNMGCSTSTQHNRCQLNGPEDGPVTHCSEQQGGVPGLAQPVAQVPRDGSGRPVAPKNELHSAFVDASTVSSISGPIRIRSPGLRLRTSIRCPRFPVDLGRQHCEENCGYFTRCHCLQPGSIWLVLGWRLIDWAYN